MADMNAALDAAKAEGNAALSAGDLAGAVASYTKGLSLVVPSKAATTSGLAEVSGATAAAWQPEVRERAAILLSNRSAAHARAGHWGSSLADAESCAVVRPDWPKAYGRVGAALVGLQRNEEAVAAYAKGLKLCGDKTEYASDKAQLHQGREQAAKLAQAQAAAQDDDDDAPGFGGANPLQKAFEGDIFAKLAQNPQTEALLHDPEVQVALKAIQSDKTGTLFSQYAQNPKVMTCIAALLGVHIPTPQEQMEQRRQQEAEEDARRHKRQEAEAQAKKEAAAAAEAAAASHRTPEQNAAVEAKDRGNDAYKKRKFEEAIAEYSKAIELDPQSNVYLNNRAAVHFEMKNFELATADSTKALEQEEAKAGRDRDDTVVARAQLRLGNIAMKLNDPEKALFWYQKSLVNNRTAATLASQQAAEKAVARKKRAANVDVDAANHHKEAGNTAFKEQRLPDAVQEYTKALSRLPDHKDKEVLTGLSADDKHNIAILYSNRAATYTKMAEHNLGLADCDRALELSPKFVKAIVRKGHLHFFVKAYQQAMEAYDKALEFAQDTEDAALKAAQEKEIQESVMRTIQAMQQRDAQARSGNVDQETIAAAERDPEIRTILGDPVMQAILQQMQDDPSSIKAHMANPMIAAKIQKLIGAGILRTG